MRMDTPVEFQTVTRGKMDPLTGNRADPVVTGKILYASVTDGASESLRLEGGAGALKEKTLTVRILGRAGPFDQLRIYGKIWKVIQRRTLRRMETFVVKEVQK